MTKYVSDSQYGILLKHFTDFFILTDRSIIRYKFHFHDGILKI